MGERQVQRPAEEPKLRADVANLKAFALRFRDALPADYYPVRPQPIGMSCRLSRWPSKPIFCLIEEGRRWLESVDFARNFLVSSASRRTFLYIASPRVRSKKLST